MAKQSVAVAEVLRRPGEESKSRCMPGALSTLGFWGAVLARVRENPRSGERGYPKIKR